MVTLSFTNQGSFTTALFNQAGVRITGSNTLSFVDFNGFGVTGGSNFNVDPGESITFTFVEGAASGIVLNTNALTDSNANGAFGEILIEAFDANGFSLGSQQTSMNGFSLNVSNLFGNQLISSFRIQAQEAFRPSALTFGLSTVNIAAIAPTSAEGNSIGGQFRISRTETSGSLVVNLSINGSSTTSAADYSIIGGSVTVSGSNLTVTIPDGVGNVDLSLSPNDDSLAETTETLQLNLATGNYLRGTNNSAAIAITDNDTATITLGVSSSSFSESGGASIIAYSSAVADKDIVVNLTFGGTAIRGTDFSTSANTLVIPAGSSTGVLAITGINDALSELTKTLSVDIASISSPVPTQQNGIQRVNLTLLDDDPVRTATAPPPINFSGTPGRTLNGSPRPDALTGTANNDILRGFAGNDRLQGLSGNDRLDGGAGNDRLEAGDGDDQLTGGDGNDSLLGGSGNDVLIGGVGADVLIGGLGSDLFVFNAVREAGDRITDFSNSADLIDLRRLFAAPAFSGANPVARFNQFVRLVQVGANTEVRIDADGRGAGTAFVTLVTLQNLSAGAIGPQNFVVV